MTVTMANKSVPIMADQRGFVSSEAPATSRMEPIAVTVKEADAPILAIRDPVLIRTSVNGAHAMEATSNTDTMSGNRAGWRESRPPSGDFLTQDVKATQKPMAARHWSTLAKIINSLGKPSQNGCWKYPELVARRKMT